MFHKGLFRNSVSTPGASRVKAEPRPIGTGQWWLVNNWGALMKAKGNENLAQAAKALAGPMTVTAAYNGWKNVLKNWTEDGSGHIQFQRLQFFESAILETRSRSYDEFMLKFKYAKFENDQGDNVFAILESMAKDAMGLVELTAPSKAA